MRPADCFKINAEEFPVGGLQVELRSLVDGEFFCGGVESDGTAGEIGSEHAGVAAFEDGFAGWDDGELVLAEGESGERGDAGVERGVTDCGGP